MSKGSFWTTALVLESHASAIEHNCCRRRAASITDPMSQAGCTQLQPVICNAHGNEESSTTMWLYDDALIACRTQRSSELVHHRYS